MKISPKQCKYTCRVIRGKSPEAAVARLQAVIDKKRPVPMAGLEVGHKKGRGLAGGRFPKNACEGIMEIVKQAAANAVVAGIENPVIAIAKSNQASAPFRKGGRRGKRTHIYIEIRNRISMEGGRRKVEGGKTRATNKTKETEK
jgi:ribosomal protein L22